MSGIKCDNTTSRETDIFWERPFLGGPVEHYKISVRDLRTGKEKTKIVKKSEKSANIDGLQPDNEYKIKVKNKICVGGFKNTRVGDSGKYVWKIAVFKICKNSHRERIGIC